MADRSADFNLNSLNFALRGHRWTKLDGSSQGLTDAFDCYSTNRNCVTVTPEPATIGLFGLGLFGIGEIGLIRRRRRRTNLQ